MTAQSQSHRLTARAQKLFHWYAIAGTENNTRDERNSIIFFAIVCPTAVVAFWGWAVFYLTYDGATYWPAAVTCGSAGVALIAPIIGRQNRFAAEVFISFVTSANYFTLSYMFGTDSGLHLALLGVALLFVLECGSRRLGVLAICVMSPLFLAAALPIWFPSPQLFTSASNELLEMIYLANVASIIFVIAFCMLIVLNRAERAEQALGREFKRSETLLANLLPTEIAARLKHAPGQIIADEIPAVTILFADIVGFTPRSARMTPEALVAFLNRIFSAFDELTAKHGLEKIKTIGDAYMVAGGMPVARPDHAEAVANMAADMIDAAERLSREMNDHVEIRIGLHTGGAVAGVIGSTKVFYDVWGATVNTAARLESYGEPGRIQVTAATRALLGDAFTFESRGEIDIKGIGPTETFWMTRPPV